MINEYNCWMQTRETASDDPVRKLMPDTVYAVPGGIIARQALAEYSRGIERLLGFRPEAHCTPDIGSDGRNVYLGTIGQLEKQLEKTIHAAAIQPEETVLGKTNQPGSTKPETAPGIDGFVINIAEGNVIIAGNNEPGLLYGVFRFLALLSTGKIRDNLHICETPASSLRIINHWDNLDGTIERGYAGKSLLYNNGRLDYDSDRIEDYARLLASTGINRISINNVNVKDKAKLLITEEYLKDAAALAAIFRKFGIRLLLSINFGAPWSLGKLPTADPLDPAVAAWWKERAALIYRHIPDLAGFLVKADSEGEPGPFQYRRTHADGANVLARAVKPFGGEIIWRCFVYNCTQDWRDRSFDRACAAYDHFMPLDGAFDENVLLQIKFGPYDFQVREPVSPLFDALKKTRHLMELQITQEYTGHQIDLCFLPWMWQDIIRGHSIEGFAAVANTGLDRNWTGHTLAQANLYGYGRMAWNPALQAADIAHEYSDLVFGPGKTAETVADILLKSYPAYEKYNAPFGICFMVTPGLHYGPNIEGYEYSRWGTYHRADMHAIGIDRTASGTGYTTQYNREKAALYADPATCPENLILFFHRLRYDYVMRNGETLLQNIYDTHFEGYEETAAMLEQWKSLKDKLDTEVYQSVLTRFELQLANAREWRDQINTYFWRKTGITDKRGRKIFD